MRISASQLKTYRRCPKLWWFTKIRKLPEAGGSSYGATFGSVFHRVAERYLKQEDPYPLGWSASLQKGDADKIKWLLTEGIEKKLLTIQEDSKIEHPFKVNLMKGVDISGIIDFLIPGEVVDHKTAKTMQYVLDEEQLAKDLQMLIYAKIAIEDKDEITLRHNVFCRFPLKAKPTRTAVTKEQIEENWKGVQVTAAGMLETSREKEPPEYHTGPHCNMYGGCSFTPICFGTESIKHYENRLKPKEEKKMDIHARHKKSTLTLHIGIVTSKDKFPDPSTRKILLADLLRELVEDEGDTLEQYYQQNAFERRDLLRTLVPRVLGKAAIISSPPYSALTPDEKALLSAIRPYADIIIECIV